MGDVGEAAILILRQSLIDCAFSSDDEAVQRSLAPGGYGDFASIADLRTYLNEAGLQLERMGPLLDPDFYVAQVPYLDRLQLSPAEHYLAIGWHMRLDPSPVFSTRQYLALNPDVAAAGVCPLDHFAEHGRNEGRVGIFNYSDFGAQDRDTVYDRVAAGFDLDYYLTRYQIPDGLDPVRHYITIGWRKLFDPSPEFSTGFYLRRSPDVVAASDVPFSHYLSIGVREGRAPNARAAAMPLQRDIVEQRIAREFDVDFYVAAHPQILINHADPLRHFCRRGWRSGWNPNADFSLDLYTAFAPDLSGPDDNPFDHYLRYGRERGRPGKIPVLGAKTVSVLRDWRSPEALALLAQDFDAEYYLTRYVDIRSSGLDPLLHYAENGWREIRDPAPWFSAAFYLEKYPDVRAMGINPLLHFILWGREAGFHTFGGGAGGQRIRRVLNAKTVTDPDLVTAKATPALARDRAVEVSKPGGRLKIAWVVPDFDVGGGGHMTIFRMVKWMELFGHECTIIVDWPMFDRTVEQRRELLLAHYQVVSSKVVMASAEVDYDYDCIVATGWQTASLTAGAPGAARRYYFVQDYEPMFYPTGARSLLAERTYSFDLFCICASRWLQAKMEAHGRPARAFELAADDCYWRLPEPASNAVPRIAFYGRSYTSRRAVELGYLALEILAERGVAFVVDIFGVHEAMTSAPFDAVHHGMVDADKLRTIYQHADIGLCFSATNYSLVPQEMMATGLPVVEIDTPSTRGAFPPGVVLAAEPSPEKIADALQILIADRAERAAQADRGHEWVSGLSWEKSAREVEAALQGVASGPSVPVKRTAVANEAPHATVIIPTYNGGPLLKTVIDRVLEQRAPWSFEVLVVDSSSSDGTWELLESYGDALTKIRIDKGEFQHGRTRNLAISRARGQFVALLTQDALPVDPFWLHNLVTVLELNPTAAGAFGPHLAYEHEPAFVKRDMRDHFRTFDRYPTLLSKFTNWDGWLSGELGWRRVLHFFSDNNSCLRRSVWERIPYPEIDYGEDQVWAARIIEAGYGRVFARRAPVYHSHSYTTMQTFERSRTEAEFFRAQFDYHDIAPKDIVAAAAHLNAKDIAWGVQNGVDPSEIRERMKLNVYALAGHAAGGVYGVDIGSAF